MSRGKEWSQLELQDDADGCEEMLSYGQFREHRGDVQMEGHGEQSANEPRDFVSLKSRVQKLEEELTSMWKSKVELAYDIGLRLFDLKSATSRDFKRTVTERLPFSYSTANSYMNVAREFDSAEDAALFDSKVMYAMATSKFPFEKRKDMISRAKRGEKITLDEVRSVRDEVRKREAARRMSVESSQIKFNQTPYMEMAGRVKALLEDIVAEIEKFQFTDELSKDEEWSRLAVWGLVEQLVQVFEPEE